MTLNVDYRVQVVLNHVGGAPEDASVNNWHFRWQNPGAPTDVDFQALKGDLSNFYSVAAPGATAALSAYLSGVIARGASPGAPHVFKAYNLIDGVTPTGPPDFEDEFPLVGATTYVNLPSEVAVCLSFYGTGYTGEAEHGAGGTRPRARRRGRVFLGPLSTRALNDAGSSTNIQRVSSTMIDDVILAATKLDTDASADDWEWSTWSKTTGTGFDVIGGWVDNAFDTQRRRGEERDSRSSFTLP